MIKEFRADPAAPHTLIQGKRLSDSLRRMHEQGRLTDAEWWAVERFRDDWALVAARGLGAVSLLPQGGGGQAGQGWLPGDAILAALRRLRMAQEKMTPALRSMAVLLVIEGHSLADAAKLIHRAKQRAAQDLRAALVLLADCYGKTHVATHH